MSKPRLSDNSLTPQPTRRQVLRWLWRLPVIAAALGGGYAVYRAAQVHFGKQQPALVPDFQIRTTVPVVKLSAFSELWQAATFEFERVPAIVIRLPDSSLGGLSVGTLHLAAFSRICPHQGCVVNFNRNPDVVAVAANYRPTSPALVCPCHLSVFLPNKAGRVVSGPARQPLPRIQLARQGDMVWATGLEIKRT